VKRVGIVLVVLVLVAAAGAPWLAPNPPDRRFDDLLFAPPTRVHIVDDGFRWPFIRPLRLVSRLERRFEESPEVMTLRWFSSDRLVGTDPNGAAPLLLLGADGLGRDSFARLLHASRVTLVLALLSTIGATLLGTVIGGVSGLVGGRADAVLERASELLMALPTIYVALTLRATLPLVVPPTVTFAALVLIFTLLGWPVVARGVRAITRSEREREYVVAAQAMGASPFRVLWRHVLPAAHGHVASQATLLVPAFILAEATLSYVGLGFPDSTPTWGTLLQDAANVSLLAEAPWMLAPALAIFVVVLGVNLVLQPTERAQVQ
jgi:peptide/nickel transport system permease protein